MYKVRKSLLRSAGILTASAIVTFSLSVSLAQTARQSDLARVTGGLAAAAIGQAQTPPVLNPNHPSTYVVQSGDTLWDIASMFLRDPWYWPEIWQINDQVANPHLIFPGDVLSLAFLDDGRPVVFREGGPGNTVRLSPRIRVEPIEEAIPTIPFETLRAFLSRPSIIAEPDLDSLPYVVAQREGLLGASGMDVYARGTAAGEGGFFNLVHLGDPLIDPDDNDVLGYEGIYVGDGAVTAGGDPSKVHLTNTTREVMVGDYLLDPENPMPANFLPRSPEAGVDGRIISVVDGISLIGQYQVVVINRGTRHGIEPGHVLSAWNAGEEINDPVRGGLMVNREKVRLPDELAGTIMVFRSFDRMSYALVMEAENELAVLDIVRNPT
jgi:LysM repeat protein